jgi:hypothetical protein
MLFMVKAPAIKIAGAFIFHVKFIRLPSPGGEGPGVG